MAKRQSPLFITLRFFDDDWNAMDELEKRNVPFERAIEIMDEFRRNGHGDKVKMELTEQAGCPVEYVTGEVTLGEV